MLGSLGFLCICINFLIKQTFRPRKWSLIQKVYLLRFVRVYLAAHAPAQATLLLFVRELGTQNHTTWKRIYLQRNEKEWELPAEATINLFLYLIFSFIYRERRVDLSNFSSQHSATMTADDETADVSKNKIRIGSPNAFGSKCIQCQIEMRMWQMCLRQEQSQRQIAIRFEIECKITWNARCLQTHLNGFDNFTSLASITAKGVRKKTVPRVWSKAKVSSVNKSNYKFLLCKCRSFAPIQWTNCHPFCAFFELKCDKLYLSRLLITPANWHCERPKRTRPCVWQYSATVIASLNFRI